MTLKLLTCCCLCLGLTTSAWATDRNIALMEAIQRGDYSQLPPGLLNAVRSAQSSAKISSTLERAPQSTIDFSIKASSELLQNAREAYVAALPPRDKARGAAVMLGSGALAEGQGKLYYFVSRSMPQSLLRAYAMEALYTGGTLVVKGLRKGDTVKEYIEEVMSEFNSVDGQVLAALEINPNLFDMFGVTTVPTTVWSNLIGLADIGAGCQSLGDAAPQVELTGPDEDPILVQKPQCAPADATTYYKITGALTTDYVIDRFESAGAPRAAMQRYRLRLAERHQDVSGGVAAQQIGNKLTPLPQKITLGAMPRGVLAHWQDQLSRANVQRGPFGPIFSNDAEDDPLYRQELTDQVQHGLGL